jgi:hypothetical protein
MIFFLFWFFAPLGQGSSAPGSQKTCVILTVDEYQDDRLIRESLESIGIGCFISESSQYISIDDFGIQKTVQLDLFSSEIEEYDPRDDGYAKKLKDFFVHDGKRFFFSFPLAVKRDLMVNLKKHLVSILEGIPFTLSVLESRRPFFLYFGLLAFGCLLTLYFLPSKRLFVFQLPLFLAMGWAGPSAFIFAAILSGIWELLRKPFGELFVAGEYKKSAFNCMQRENSSPLKAMLDYAGSGVLERLKPFKINILLVLFFLFFLAGLSFAGLLSPIPTAASFMLFFFLYFLSFRFESEKIRINRHIPFTPVLLLPKRHGTFYLSRRLLPFAVLSLPALFLPGNSAVSPEAIIDPRYFVLSEDFYRHINFQQSFSYRSLNHLPLSREGLAPLIPNAYLSYYLGDDGLIVGALGEASALEEMYAAGEEPAASPAFPLEELTAFLVDYSGKAVGSADSKEKEWISVGIIFIACFLDLTRFLYQKKNLVLSEKRIIP